MSKKKSIILSYNFPIIFLIVGFILALGGALLETYFIILNSYIYLYIGIAFMIASLAIAIFRYLEESDKEIATRPNSDSENKTNETNSPKSDTT